MDKLNIDIVYEDDGLIICDKPQGLATSKGKNTSLCDIVFKMRPELSAVKGYNTGEGGLLNRLDNETGGLVLIAKNDESFAFYSKLMKDEKVTKYYYAICDGEIKVARGVVDVPIAHHPKSSRKMVVINSTHNKFRGKPHISWTNWDFVKDVGKFRLLKVSIVKGLRHQIRVHLASKGLPIVGDKLYNKKTYDVKHHQLYCYAVDFSTPKGEKKLVQIKDKLELNT